MSLIKEVYGNLLQNTTSAYIQGSLVVTGNVIVNGEPLPTLIARVKAASTAPTVLVGGDANGQYALSSNDGVSWTKSRASAGGRFTAAAWGVRKEDNGSLTPIVIAGLSDHGTKPWSLVVSEDNGVNWTAYVGQGTDGLFASCTGVACSPQGTWHAVGTPARFGSFTMARSQDGFQTWTQVTVAGASSNTAFASVAYSHGAWVAAGTRGEIAYSQDDGVTWAVSPSWTGVPGGAIFPNSAIATDGSTWMAAAGGKCLISRNTTDWTQVVDQPLPTTLGITYSPTLGAFVVVGTPERRGRPAICYTRSFGGMWQAGPDQPFDVAGTSVAWCGTQFVAVGSGNSASNVAYSQDGFYWTAQPLQDAPVLTGAVVSSSSGFM